jgi:hypothetical protein
VITISREKPPRPCDATGRSEESDHKTPSGLAPEWTLREHVSGAVSAAGANTPALFSTGQEERSACARFAGAPFWLPSPGNEVMFNELTTSASASHITALVVFVVVICVGLGVFVYEALAADKWPWR